MKLKGSYLINLDKNKVWEALYNPEKLKQDIPR